MEIPPKTPKLEDRLTDAEISLSRSELYARLQVEKRHVASLEESCATLLKENYELKASNAELSQKIEIINEGIGEVVSKAISDIASGVKSLKAMAYDVGKGCNNGGKRSRDCNPMGYQADSTFLLDSIHDCARRAPTATPMNTPVIVVPPALRAPVHGSESIRRAQAQVIIATSPNKQNTTTDEPTNPSIPAPAKTIPQETVIDVVASKVSPAEEAGTTEDTTIVAEDKSKTPVRATRHAKPTERMSVHPIVMKSVRKPSVDNMKRRTTMVPESTAPKVMRTEMGPTSTKPTIQSRGVVIQKKPVAAIVGEGSARDRMDPALASSTSTLTRKAGQTAAPTTKADQAIKKTVTKRAVRGGRGSEV